MKTKQYME